MVDALVIILPIVVFNGVSNFQLCLDVLGVQWRCCLVFRTIMRIYRTDGRVSNRRTSRRNHIINHCSSNNC